MKKGINCTEFWLATGATGAALVTVICAIAFDWNLTAALLGTALSPTITYIGGRSAVKSIKG